MPGPVSRTLMRAMAPVRSSRSSTEPPSGVNLMAFDRRFQTTCCSRWESPTIDPAREWRTTLRTMCLASADGCTASIAPRTTSTGSTGAISS
jgi:hypothetical protein